MKKKTNEELRSNMIEKSKKHKRDDILINCGFIVLGIIGVAAMIILFLML